MAINKIVISFGIKGIENYGIDSKEKVYRLPFHSGNRYYPLKEIIPQVHSGRPYYRINKLRFSLEKIIGLAYPLPQKKQYAASFAGVSQISKREKKETIDTTTNTPNTTT